MLGGDTSRGGAVQDVAHLLIHLVNDRVEFVGALALARAESEVSVISAASRACRVVHTRPDASLAGANPL